MPMPLLRVLTLPFRSELCLFLTLSLLSLVFGIFESLLYTKFFDEVESSESHGIQHRADDDLDAGQSVLESKSVFFIAVICLFGFVYLSSKILYFLFFGGLSETEHARLSRMLFKFVILRSIILSGALSVSTLLSVFSWLLWFSALGVTHSCALVATVRCNRFSASSRIALREWFRMISTLIFLSVSCWFLLVSGLSHRYLLADVRATGGDQSSAADPIQKRSLINSLNAPTAMGVIVARMTAYKHTDLESVDVAIYLVSEIILLLCLVLHLFAGLSIQAYDRWKLHHGQTWPQQNVFTYYLDLIHVISYHFVEIVHYSHLLLWSRIFSVASVIVFLHIRSAYSLLSNRIRRHLAYRRLSKFIADNYFLCTSQKAAQPDGNDSDISDQKKDNDLGSEQPSKDLGDICAICWEPMLTWRRLPCRHNFHEPCLRSWLEQNPSCPTCRLDLSIPPSILSSATRSSSNSDRFGLGLILRDFTRAARTMPTAPNAESQAPAPVVNRNLFAAAVGLNLGVSIGSAPIVAAAAQAVARETIPSVPSNGSTASPGVVAAADPTGSPDIGSEIQEMPGSSSSSSPAPPTDTSQSTSPTNPAQPDETGQIRRRSFHFDGSRYFSWLPSLHVELSQVIREVFSGGVMDQPAAPRVMAPPPLRSGTATAENLNSFDPNAYDLIRLPASLRQPAQEIAAMFPQFPLSEIVADLLITGVPEATVENLVQRPAPSVAIETAHDPEPLPIDRTDLSEPQNEQPTGAPSTSASSDSTNTYLVERRRAMLEGARRRFLSNNPST